MEVNVTPAPAPTHPRKATFLQRSASVASLVAWKARFESYSGRFTRKPSFVSYATFGEIMDEGDMRCKLPRCRESIDEGYNTGSENDFPPEYDEVVTPPPPHQEQKDEPQFFKQDFTALENYFKKTLSIKKMKGCNKGGENENATERVFQWLHGLPEGDNLEEFLDAYGIPTEGVNLEDMKAHLKIFIRERLANEQGVNGSHAEDYHEKDEGVSIDSEDDILPRWERQMADLKELAEGDNFEHWLEGLDVPFYRPIPDTKDEIRKYLRLHLDAYPPEPPPKPTLAPDPPQIKDIEAMAPQWKELVEKMRSLKNEDELDKWLDSLEVPCCIPHDTFKAAIKKFFMHEEFENFAGKSIIFKEDTFAKKLWERFEDAGVLKQVTLVAGTTVVMGLVAVLSTTLLSFAIPVGATFAIVPLFTEVFAQYFLQRQEIAFNLFNVHAQNAKPLSTAWAKQYILYKYC